MGPSAGAWGTLETGSTERSQKPPALTRPGPAHPTPGAHGQVRRAQGSLCWVPRQEAQGRLLGSGPRQKGC